ncbi:fad binding domain-containing protein [Apiospora rasikravindrae]|uniref:Fad binding domain-containing protein n=1 Tax=Apiospora rasikravindrae TaxID=990691 RepID=A0ABR1SZG5_9PEZI
MSSPKIAVGGSNHGILPASSTRSIYPNTQWTSSSLPSLASSPRAPESCWVRKPPDFKAAMERWSSLDSKVPFAIIQPAEERDILATVQAALQAGIPLVPVSGGLSPWSKTIGQEGIVIDLSNYKGDLKHFAQSGLRDSNPKKLPQVHVEAIELHAPCKTELESSFVIENVDVLAVSRPPSLSWYIKPVNHEFVAAIGGKEAQVAHVSGTHEEVFVSYTKEQYDPAGIFTKQLL